MFRKGEMLLGNRAVCNKAIYKMVLPKGGNIALDPSIHITQKDKFP